MLDEGRDVLSRPEIRARTPSLADARLKQVPAATLELSVWISDVPRVFGWPQHPDDDHVFNLAIAAAADFLVTWENRIINLATDNTPDAARLRGLAPQLRIVTPKQLAEIVRSESSSSEP